MREIFLKSVRKDGSSVWAPPGLGVIYEIGKRYTFPKGLPAHVFRVPASGLSPEAFCQRAECGGSSRVLICYGCIKERLVPYVDIHDFDFNYSTSPVDRAKLVFSSYDFEVIGEMFVPWSETITERPRKCDLVSDNIMKWLQAYRT